MKNEAKPEAQNDLTVAAMTPDQQLFSDLQSENQALRKAARVLFSIIADSGRSWAQLPSDLKSAARFDALALYDAGGDAALIKGGYSARIAEQILRDLGKNQG